jgi:hypothetical protein
MNMLFDVVITQINCNNYRFIAGFLHLFLNAMNISSQLLADAGNSNISILPIVMPTMC